MKPKESLQLIEQKTATKIAFLFLGVQIVSILKSLELHQV